MLVFEVRVILVKGHFYKGQISGERSQDQWSSGYYFEIAFFLFPNCEIKLQLTKTFLYLLIDWFNGLSTSN